MKGKTILTTIVCLILSSVVFFVGYTKITEPKELYRVYLAGDTIGYIQDKDVLEEYIDNEQSELKTKYKVDRVYPPNDLDIVKEITYNQSISSEKTIYEKIKNISPFTINGYIVTIKGTEEVNEDEGEHKTEDKKISVVDKNIFSKAIKESLFAFISEENYNKFINDTQTPIKDTGTIIEDLYIKNNITIKEARVSTTDKIFTNTDELARYLLFGTTEKQQTYTVKDGDTISDIAEKNKLNVLEFLIANPEFTSENNLLYAGQKVNLGLINPVYSLVEVDHTVTLETIKYETKVEYDANVMIGYEKVKQEGHDGLSKVTRKIQKVNGEIIQAVTTNTETIKKVQDKIVVKGKNPGGTFTIIGQWAWPTLRPYTISSEYAWRWGKMHEGIDITGPGEGSPIFAANNGVVKEVSYNGYNGNFIVLDHGNGIVTVYAHLRDRLVTKGQIVTIGQKIGTMGHTGFATGTHLHFGVYRGSFVTRNRGGHNDISPWSLYR